MSAWISPASRRPRSSGNRTSGRSAGHPIRENSWSGFTLETRIAAGILHIVNVEPINCVITNANRAIERAATKFEERAREVSEGRIETEDLAGTIEDRLTVQANVATIRAEDRMIGTLLDTVA